jgi:hypothetical protein
MRGGQRDEESTLLLTLPTYNCTFPELVSDVTYKNFVIRLGELNPLTLTRSAAEEAWKSLITQKGKEWKARSGGGKKSFLWSQANAQVRRYQGDIFSGALAD